MGKKAPSAPAPPDPKATAAAQSQLNKETAVTQAMLDRQVAYSGPYGTVRYVRTDPGTLPYEQGQFEQQVVLTPEGQALQAQEIALDRGMNQTAIDQLGRVQSTLAQPVNFSGSTSVEDALYDPYRRRLDERFGNEEAAMRSRLANQGIQMGSEAYNREIDRFAQGKNDAYGATVAQARAQAVQEALAQRNQPINEISALMGGQQVVVPQFMPQQAPQLAGTDITGPTALAYQASLENWRAQQAQRASLMGGLASLGGALGGAAITKWSDRRMKTDIRRVGTLENGLAVYAYRYRYGGPVEIGLMADEVAQVRPEAVHSIAGLLSVDYGAATR